MDSETIAQHWGVEPSAVTVTTEPAHGGWVARARVELEHRTERFSETGLDPETARGRLVEASLHRADGLRRAS